MNLCVLFYQFQLDLKRCRTLYLVFECVFLDSFASSDTNWTGLNVKLVKSLWKGEISSSVLDDFWQSIYFTATSCGCPASLLRTEGSERIARRAAYKQQSHNNTQQQQHTVKEKTVSALQMGPEPSQALPATACTVCWKQRWRIKYHVARWSEGGTQWERERGRWLAIIRDNGELGGRSALLLSGC